MTFDTSVLSNRVFGLIAKNKLDKSVQFIDTLKFPTKAPSAAVTSALDMLFGEVFETAEVFGVDLQATRGTFAVDTKNQRLYEPSIGEHNGEAVISWGYKVYLVATLLNDESKYCTIRENNKLFELVVDADGKRGVLKLWTKKGKTYTKSQLVQKLTDKSGKQLATALAAVRVPSLNILTLAKYIGDVLNIKSLTTQEGGQWGITGAVEFYELPERHYRANANFIGKVLAGYMGDEQTNHSWKHGEMLFKPLEVKSGQMGDYLHYIVTDLTCVDDDDDFSYNEDDVNSPLATVVDEEEEEFEYEVD